MKISWHWTPPQDPPQIVLSFTQQQQRTPHLPATCSGSFFFLHTTPVARFGLWFSVSATRLLEGRSMTAFNSRMRLSCLARRMHEGSRPQSSCRGRGNGGVRNFRYCESNKRARGQQKGERQPYPPSRPFCLTIVCGSLYTRSPLSRSGCSRTLTNYVATRH